MAKRLDYLDKAKGLLIILVVIGHIWQSGPVFNTIYAFHMPAFFVISGILLNETESYKKKFGAFLLSRLFAFGIPFIWIEILGCLTDIVRHGINLNVKGYLYNTVTMHFNDPNLWFLMDLFLIELLFFWVIRLLKKKPLIFAAAVVLFAVSFFLPTANHYISTVSGVLYYTLFFACGFCAAEWFKKLHVPACVVSIVAVLAVGLLLGREGERVLSLTTLAFVASGLCGAYAVIQIGKISFPKPINCGLIKAGMNTILIFGTHHFYYAVIGTLLGVSDYRTTPVIPGLIMLFGVAILEIPTIFVINRWVPWLAGKRKSRTLTKQ